MSNLLLVVDDLEDINGFGFDDRAISFAQYLEDHPKKGEKKLSLINLCDSGKYLSRGYYCSLLAEARGHRVMPSVNTINDLRSKLLYMSRITGELLLSGSNTGGEGEKKTFYVNFGVASDPGFSRFGQRLFSVYPAPMLKVVLFWSGGWQVKSIVAISLGKLPKAERPKFLEAMLKFNEKRWQSPKKKKSYRWELGVLVDPKEIMPPSNKEALSRFIKAAAKCNINAELITARDYPRLGEYDGLFIRETTAIDHHTFRFARKAEIEGMVVIDDPTSILRCCNKVFLQDAFTYNGVPALKTQVFSTHTPDDLDAIEKEFGYPVVLKIPEGSFSKGVFKAANREELLAHLAELLKTTALVLVQEYLYTDFDWRIGVFNNRPLYACRYYMARNHWQIYNHGSKRFNSGGFETLPTYEVPREVLDAALRAAKVIGSGLYGVDIKHQGKQAYVIEINDNPNIDYKVEDVYLGDELYMLVMAEMARRLELKGR